MIVGGLPAWKELPMPRHLEQIRAEPERPVTLFDHDVAVLIGLVATVEAEMRPVMLRLPSPAGSSATSRGMSCCELSMATLTWRRR